LAHFIESVVKMPPKKGRSTQNANPQIPENLNTSSTKKNVLERDSKIPDTPNPLFEELLKPHVESFNEFLDSVNTIIPYMDPVTIKLNERKVKLSIRDIQIGKPFDYKRNVPLIPHEVNFPSSHGI
jgi:DNA-directed RNA polymerase beta subunit